jgi:hypothetical protein
MSALCEDGRARSTEAAGRGHERGVSPTSRPSGSPSTGRCPCCLHDDLLRATPDFVTDVAVDHERCRARRRGGTTGRGLARPARPSHRRWHQTDRGGIASQSLNQTPSVYALEKVPIRPHRSSVAVAGPWRPSIKPPPHAHAPLRSGYRASPARDDHRPRTDDAAIIDRERTACRHHRRSNDLHDTVGDLSPSLRPLRRRHSRRQNRPLPRAMGALPGGSRSARPFWASAPDTHPKNEQRPDQTWRGTPPPHYRRFAGPFPTLALTA